MSLEHSTLLGPCDGTLDLGYCFQWVTTVWWHGEKEKHNSILFRMAIIKNNNCNNKEYLVSNYYHCFK